MGRFDAPGYGRGRAGRGRHSGGRGVGFGPGRGGGGGRGHSISPSNAYQLTAEQKEAMLLPFLHPTPRALVPVPLEFESVRHFCDLIANNLLAEFWHLIQEGPRGPAVKATPAAGGRPARHVRRRIKRRRKRHAPPSAHRAKAALGGVPERRHDQRADG
jgi:hypothetical protein